MRPVHHKILISRLIYSTRRLPTIHSQKLAYSSSSTHPKPSSEPPKSWLTRKVETSPVARSIFFAIARLLGYRSTRQIAGIRGFALYQKICIPRADEDSTFWRESCHLPPTFQSWFTITNLHIWLLTVRLRALPNPHADAYIQALIDHFFIDTEDRIRAILQPPSPSSSPQPKPYTTPSHFYPTPNDPTKKKKRGRAPDRLVTRQMRIFKEQWTGMGMAFDLGLVNKTDDSDMELAGAIWRNLLGARGARGIAYTSPTPTPTFRRAVNLVGGLVEDPAKVDQRGLDVEEATDDHSGVHDFPPEEADKYVGFPETMVDVVTYIRRELRRLERVEDEVIISGDLMQLRFGRIKG